MHASAGHRDLGHAQRVLYTMNPSRPPEPLELRPIGVVRSCYHERFGVPRQAGLVPAAEGEFHPFPPWDRADAWRGLEGFSHLWLIFWMHLNPQGPAHHLVRPPRLGGNRRMGVFATRSPMRPNPIGLSVARLLGLEHRAGRVHLHLGGIDLVDGTPVLDVKPYIPYADALPGAQAGFAPQAPDPGLKVSFATKVAERLRDMGRQGVELRRLIEQVLAQDPRPAYRKGSARYGMALAGHEIRWRRENGRVEVTALEPRRG